MAVGFKSATVNAASVPATQTSFPSYVDLSRLGITTLAEAQSVRVYADAAKVTEWAREIVSLSQMWVKVPSLTSTVAMFVDWDGVRADYAVGDTYGRNAVWSSFTGVWHMEDTNSSTGSYDATNTGATSGTAAKIGNGYDFGGVLEDDRLETTSNAPALSGNWSVSSTFKCDTLINYAGIFSKLSTTRNGVSSNQDLILIAHNDGKIGANPGGSWHFSTAAGIATATWYKATWTYNNTTNVISYYVNGTAYGTTSSFSPTENTTFKFFMGSWNSTVNDYRLDGIIDDTYIIESELSANWITTEQNNRFAESTFWGTWTTVASGNTTNFFFMMG